MKRSLRRGGELKLAFVHLLNDASGSPRMLSATMAVLARSHPGSVLFLGSGGDGVLTQSGVLVRRYWYRRMSRRLLTSITYLLSQLALFFRMLTSSEVGKGSVIWVNTLLPIGAAIYGRLAGIPVVYHLHEISVAPRPLRWFLMTVARLTSSMNVYVSDAHCRALPIRGVPSKIVHNCVSSEFMANACVSIYEPRKEGRFRVLMIASLRGYKGVSEYVALAARLERRSDLVFDLVLNEDHEYIVRNFSANSMPSNLVVHSRILDPSAFYADASLLVNLSRVDLCVETFGLTLLEAMAYGVPVIAPPVGGPAEVVRDGVEGFLIDSRRLDELSSAVLRMADDEELCKLLSEAGRRRASYFSAEAYGRGVRSVLEAVVSP